MAKYERKEKELAQIVEDTLTIAGVVKQDEDVDLYSLVAYNHSEEKWVKFVKETHKTGFAIAMVKKEKGTEFDNTGKDDVVPLLKIGIVNKEVVKKAFSELDEETVGICLAQGLAIL
ncbi:hypothetical protein [Fusobacterium necrophorum]|uniref:Uncharacterized protein n=2 Tax=Fusobacterium necrophorum TaxID=859 RepID=A0AAN3VXA7_9FUSO|nr:hypothetical protein [Fusobacterium necrophorum]AYV94697.1 hypothetical protein BWX37_03285 [Fusobacterium necrophorum subsp. funduliforme]EJU18835.1 hypothetical protein HMPREF1127_1077 [Fusobacterium necrophorum subsp. funduliforme Fnf 1007]KYL02941.1 hypothetical protein A2J06_09790 [Fusobacterium necrophorum subsp. funduliforme]KYM37675.1 hypothetical protein A2U03_10685 [Fusobacterium necrophorum subsp. funduliforme]KYM52186.1 hypothetical protein A2U04_10225 [Fusobacterium necrophorum